VFQTFSADIIAYGARIAAELGADIVKTLYVEGFEKVTRGVPAPVVILGGARASIEEVLKWVERAVRAGAAGAAIGRNIFQHEKPRAVVEALMAIIHRGESAEEAAGKYLT
ncbi:MAG: aldolase, partial [Thermofilum sp.]